MTLLRSLTPQEWVNPRLFNGSGRKRISEGSGNSMQDINKFIKQFDEMRKMMKTMTKMASAGRSLKKLPFGN